AWSSLEPVLSRLIYEKTGIYTATQRIEDVKLLKDLESAQLKAEIQELRTEIDKLKSQNAP
ncbi:MAG TPA: hypothetical protein VGE04_08475, partial [Chloroflexia bacterium]